MSTLTGTQIWLLTAAVAVAAASYRYVGRVLNRYVNGDHTISRVNAANLTFILVVCMVLLAFGGPAAHQWNALALMVAIPGIWAIFAGWLRVFMKLQRTPVTTPLPWNLLGRDAVFIIGGAVMAYVGCSI